MLRSKPVPVVSSLGAAIFGIVIALGAALLVIPIFPESEDLVVGNIVKRDLVSQYDISYVSDKLTEAEEEKAAVNEHKSYLKKVLGDMVAKEHETLQNDMLNSLKPEEPKTDGEDEENKDKKLGDEILQPLPSFDFGRIAAQTAKQVISFNAVSYTHLTLPTNREV